MKILHLKFYCIFLLSFTLFFIETASLQAAQKILLPPPGQIYHAVYPGPEDLSGQEDKITPQSLLNYTNVVGKSPAWVYFSDEWGTSRAFPNTTVNWIRQSGSVPFIRLMLRSTPDQNVAEPLFTLDRINAGNFDADFRAWARAAKNEGGPILAEYGTEMNGEWFSWNGVWNGGAAGPAKFKSAYQHIIQIMREEGANNILWCFHVNHNDVPEDSWNRFENYYPGDQWIDWIGVSIYGVQTPMQTYWPIFRQNMDAVYPRLTALHPTKPIALLEFGLTKNNPNGSQSTWAQDALIDLVGLRWPRIIGFSWWNEGWQNDSNPAHNTDMRVQSSPSLITVFQTWVRDKNNVLGRLLLSRRRNFLVE